MHVILKDISQLDSLKRHDSFDAICEKCGTKYSVNDFRPERIERYKRILCQPCYAKSIKEERYGNPNFNNRNKSKETCLNKYGVENPQQDESIRKRTQETLEKEYGGVGFASDSISDKCKKTSFDTYGNEKYNNREKFVCTMNEKYGVSYSAESKEIRDKMNRTRQERYGDQGYTNREKAKETMLELYGVENPTQLKEVQDRIKETRYNKFGEYNNMPKLISTVRERYGVDCVFQNGYISDKAKETCLDKYGNEVYSKSEHYQQRKSEYIEKMAKTMNERYGVDCFTKCDSYKDMMIELRELHPEIFQSSTRFIYNEFTFDSIPEFCVYIYCIDHWIPIIRNYTQYFKYIDIRGKAHRVYPDFIINGNLVEIKGGHFFKEDGTMYLPYRNPEWDDEEYEYQSSIYTSKWKCLLSNGVQILKDTDEWVQNCITYVKMIEYARGNYGFKFMSDFIKSNPNNLCYGYTPFNCNRSKEYQDPIGLGKTPFDI